MRAVVGGSCRATGGVFDPQESVEELHLRLPGAVSPSIIDGKPNSRGTTATGVTPRLRHNRTRIALISPLTTNQPNPKDADLLVSATQDADLAPLARLRRRLQGRAQGSNRGGDIFLVDPLGNYLGRICPWKEYG